MLRLFRRLARAHADPVANGPPPVPLRVWPALIWDRFLGWFYSRRLQPFFLGLPALALALAVVSTVAFQWKAPKDKLVDRYQRSVKTALQDQDFPTAEICLRKLKRLAPKDDRTVYGLAKIAQHKGDLSGASRLMERIAPIDRIGYGPAHFWTAQRISQRHEGLTNEQIRSLVHHLESTLASEPDHTDARIMLARVELARRNFERALGHLVAIVDARPAVRLTIAKIHLHQGATSRGQAEAERAAKYFREQVEQDKNNIAARLSWAESVWLQGEFSVAVSILRAGLVNSDDRRLKMAMADLYVNQCGRVWDWPQTDLGARLELLQRALYYRPNHPQALNRLATFVDQSGEVAEEARQMLKDVLAEGKATSTVHLILGTNRAAADDLDQAMVHLEQAYRLNPQMPVVLNNLAWVLANSAEPQLDRALELTNSALRLAPAQPEIRETRGQILVRMQRWQEALVDLELALRGFPKRSQLHATLALVYKKLGDTELAEKHKQRAANLMEKQTSETSN